MFCLTSGSQGFVACPQVGSGLPHGLQRKSKLLCQEDWASLAVLVEPFFPQCRKPCLLDVELKLASAGKEGLST